jgi:PHP family Zn ribbon phosphoesterase
VAEGIGKVRSGDIVIKPGYDGVFGEVTIWKEGEDVQDEVKADQEVLF